jgi:hypothetical protein
VRKRVRFSACGLCCGPAGAAHRRFHPPWRVRWRPLCGRQPWCALCCPRARAELRVQLSCGCAQMKPALRWLKLPERTPAPEIGLRSGPLREGADIQSSFSVRRWKRGRECLRGCG